LPKMLAVEIPLVRRDLQGDFFDLHSA